MFVAGALATIVALSPLVVDGPEPAGVWWFLSMLTGVGFLMILVGLLGNARSRRRTVRRLSRT